MRVASKVMALVVVLSCGYNLYSASAQSAPRYSIKDTGLLSQAYAISSHSEIVGASNSHAFLWTSGRISALSFLPTASTSFAFGINSKGYVVGWTGQTAFLWNSKKLVGLPPLPQPATPAVDRSPSASGIQEPPTYAYSINDKNWIVGDAQTPSHVQHAVLWKKGRILDLSSDLGLLDSSRSQARSVNNRGQIVVWAVRLPDHLAFLWENGRSKELGKFEPCAINNKGEVVGLHNSEAVLWSHDKLIPLPALPDKKDIEATAALAINDSGQAVGVTGRYPLSFDGDNLSPWRNRIKGYAVLWQGGQAFDLNSLIPSDAGWQLEQATGINKQGCIVGTGIFKGNDHAFILTPLRK